MTINGTNTEQWGLLVESASGGYDMPGRLGEYVYDWGDSYEPLFGSNYTRWAPRLFRVKFLYDPRRKNITVGANQVHDLLASFGTDDLTLVLTDASGAIGTHTVQLNQVVGWKRYKGGQERFTVEFRERVPAFEGALPGTQNGGTFSIDGYSFAQFGCKLIRPLNLAGVGSAIESNATYFTSAPAIRQQRALKSFGLQLVLHDANPIVKMASLHKVLSQDKVLPFVLDSYTFDTMFAAGFQSQRKDSKTQVFTLNLIRL